MANWAITPMMTALGRLNKISKSEGLSVKPIPNMMMPRSQGMLRADPFEGIGCEKSDTGKERSPKGKCFSNKVADFIEDTHDNML